MLQRTAKGEQTVMEKLKGQLESYKSQSFSLVLRLLMWIATFLTVGIMYADISILIVPTVESRIT